MSSQDYSSLEKLLNTFKQNTKLYYTEDELKNEQDKIFKLSIDYKSKCKLLKEQLKTDRNYNELQSIYPSIDKKNDLDKLFKINELYLQIKDII